MFPIVDTDGLAKPVIQVIGEEAINAGVEEICLVTQPGEEEQYRNYFKRMSDDTLKAFKGKEWALQASEQLQRFDSGTSCTCSPTSSASRAATTGPATR